jgi:hypothetical protein
MYIVARIFGQKPHSPNHFATIDGFLYSVHYYNTVLHDFRESEGLLTLYIIEAQPPYPGKGPELKLRRDSTETPLATVIRPRPPFP